jgi:hypothetical protein
VQAGKIMVRLVSAMVDAMADMLHEDDKSESVMEITGRLYEWLAVNCKEKAEMSRALRQSTPPSWESLGDAAERVGDKLKKAP